MQILSVLVLFCLFLSENPLQGAGMDWPAERIFPRFSPVQNLDLVNRAALPTEMQTAVVTLQGLVNRTQPRIYIHEDSVQARLWLQEINVQSRTIGDPMTLFSQYRNEIKGLIIYDERQPDTINLATTIAGIRDGIAVSPQMADRLRGAPYQLPVLQDLRDLRFNSRLAVYQYEYDQYAQVASHRIIFGLNPDIKGHLRDYAVATRGLMIWLNPNQPGEGALLDKFLALCPPNSPYLGWWTSEGNGVHAASRFGIPVYAADWSSNLTVLGGKQIPITMPHNPPPPPLQNKLYVSIIMSDGDNLQEDQGLIPLKWADGNRGQVPVGWTVNPALVEIAPVILNYFQKTATPNDVLISGPSGLGYTYPAAWPRGTFAQYAKLTGDFMRRGGLRVATIWNNGVDLSNEHAQAYVDNVPGLVGLTIQDESRPVRILGARTPIFRFNISYGDNEDILARGIDDKLRTYRGAAPEFVAVQGNMNMGPINPTAFLNLKKRYANNPNVVFVRPDHFFQLIAAFNRPAKHKFVEGDFNGDGKADVGFYGVDKGDFWMGQSTDQTLNWAQAGNVRSFGNLLDSNHDFFDGDFNGDGKSDLMFAAHGDGNWWFGLSNGRSLEWSLATKTSGFGTFRDGMHKVMTGDFNGDGKTDALFYFSGDSNWWLGLSNGKELKWQLAGNTQGLQNLLDEKHRLFTGDFNGDGKSDVAMFHSGDGNWWFGLSDGQALNFRQASAVPGFGNLLDQNHSIQITDINGDGRSDVVFYYSGDGNIWSGISDGQNLRWELSGNASRLGDLMDSDHRMIWADFNGDGRQDLLVYSGRDGNLQLGLSQGSQLAWTLAGNAQNFGNLLDPTRQLFFGDYNGDGKMDLLFYYSIDGNWWGGLSDGSKFNWQKAANTQSLGDLIQ